MLVWAGRQWTKASFYSHLALLRSYSSNITPLIFKQQNALHYSKPKHFTFPFLFFFLVLVGFFGKEPHVKHIMRILKSGLGLIPCALLFLRLLRWKAKAGPHVGYSLWSRSTRFIHWLVQLRIFQIRLKKTGC